LPAALEKGALLIRLATTRTIRKNGNGVSRIKKRVMTPEQMEKEYGLPTSFVCPECNGPFWETKAGASLQFRCHVGHAYSPDSLLADHADGLERALWSAVRTFDERASLMRRLGKRHYHSESVGKNWHAKANELERHAEAIRKLLQTSQGN
jgi:two-component system chemotaxis response regulator CheB